jgi:hypothetical protein
MHSNFQKEKKNINQRKRRNIPLPKRNPNNNNPRLKNPKLKSQRKKRKRRNPRRRSIPSTYCQHLLSTSMTIREPSSLRKI